MQHCLARILLTSGLALLATACATPGSGVSPSTPAATKPSFSWHVEGWMRGTMTATLSNGDVYEGPYFQVDRHTKLERLAQLWPGWEGRSHWRGWDGWGLGLSTTMIYTPRVLANLIKPNGERMRCRFTLTDPSTGMAGGGIGRCQFSNGKLINAGFAQE